ncbi:MAG: TIGR03747 family integrating conjugative element membrane protein [gamma proteobacterium endosymbiont of Lamellibrachia anaximandri]|nr:TIGR03747 family integrating conjugative element membrane protein [gamma proteobacterium endosymbiont of Lamellibrachia anaximandri]MBL3535618.1 TIGR03747 family integrating conjugative element membrane protein [gamma proteobacterium endosymbiont of Lamellibrachia anaximandri]
MAQAASANAPRHPVERGLIGQTFHIIFQAITLMLVALIFSILVEWTGMTFIWLDEGPTHSRDMLATELSYLNEDFKRSIVTTNPARYAKRFADAFYQYGFEWTGFVDFMAWVQAPPYAGDSRLRTSLRKIYLPIAEYLLAAMTVTQVFAVRMAVLTLAMPVFLLFGLVGVTDGLVQRDLRRWGGGRESSFVYHHAKRFILPIVLGAWFIYLSMPVSVHPNFVILPFAALFAMAVAITSGTFKKYL